VRRDVSASGTKLIDSQFTIGMWFSDHHPCGKFSRPSGYNINGRVAWAVMESVGPLHMLYLVWNFSRQFSIQELPIWNAVMVLLYCVHYVNRAYIGPLLVAPSISPVGIEIFLMVCWHNWFNTACLTPWIMGYHTSILGFDGLATISTETSKSVASRTVPYIGLALFVLGMTNNILAEHRLWRMRREEGQRRAQVSSSKGVPASGNIYHKVYVIPPADGLFRYCLYPHYLWEWIEWLGFVLVGVAVQTTIAPTGAMQSPALRLAPWNLPFAWAAQYFNTALPLAPLAYVINFIACMPPQARRGLRWYKKEFGEEAVAGRSAIVPGFSWW
jgi:3-oxo-5-alpha-steroid 4-dehydrogenase 1